MPRPFTFIVGCHGSGTSAVAGLVSGSGLNIGGPGGQDKTHPRGIFEDSHAVNDINGQIYADLGCSWHETPSLQRLETYINPKADRLILRYVEEHDGVKDPKLCVLFPLWRRLIMDCRVVMVRRSIQENVKSLLRRAKRWGVDGKHKTRDAQYVLGLVSRQVHVADIVTAGENRVFIDYDELMEDPSVVYARLYEFLAPPHRMTDDELSDLLVRA